MTSVQLGRGLGRSHGTSSRQPFDRWFRYPAGFASDYVSRLMEALGLDEGVVVDCFAGSGVTGTAARANGLSFIGIEAHPLVAELASLKFPSSDVDPVRLVALAADLVDSVRVGAKPITEARVLEEPDLVRRSFDRETLQVLVGLRSAIHELDEAEAGYLKWALLGVLREVANVKVGWPYQRPAIARKATHADPYERFIVRSGWIAEDLSLTRSLPATSSEIRQGDSRDPALWVGVKAAGCVSSPPYLNNFDYADATRLETHFWGLTSSWRDMTLKVRSEMLIATTQQSSRAEQRAAAERISELGSVGEEIAGIAAALTETRIARGPRAKQYDQVIGPYFSAIDHILTNLSGSLAPDARAVWLIGDSAPYGVYVDTPRLIGMLAQRHSFDIELDETVRERGHRWASTGMRHDAKLSERMLVLRRS